MDTSSLATEIRWSANLFIESLNAFPEENLNIIPFPGSWTAGQVVDHIIKATAGVPDKVTKPAGREPDLQVELLKSVFLNFSTKLSSPEFIIPDNGPFEKSVQLSELIKNRETNINIILTQDLTELCAEFELPQLGYLTRYEWMKLISFHTQRHTYQLNKIAGSFAGVRAQLV
jgi:hypothetical protein